MDASADLFSFTIHRAPVRLCEGSVAWMGKAHSSLGGCTLLALHLSGIDWGSSPKSICIKARRLNVWVGNWRERVVSLGAPDARVLAFIALGERFLLDVLLSMATGSMFSAVVLVVGCLLQGTLATTEGHRGTNRHVFYAVEMDGGIKAARALAEQHGLEFIQRSLLHHSSLLRPHPPVPPIPRNPLASPSLSHASSLLQPARSPPLSKMKCAGVRGVVGSLKCLFTLKDSRGRPDRASFENRLATTAGLVYLFHPISLCAPPSLATFNKPFCITLRAHNAASSPGFRCQGNRHPRRHPMTAQGEGGGTGGVGASALSFLQERAVKGMRANWVALVLEEEEEAARDFPVAKGIGKHLQTYMFPVLTHLLSDILAVVNCMNLTFQKDVNISSIQRVMNMTLASLEDLMNGPEYIAELTKSIKKRFPLEHVGIISDLDTALNASHYPGANSMLKSYGLDALECVCYRNESQRGAAAPLVQKERTMRDFPPGEASACRISAGNPTFRVLPTSDHFLRGNVEVALVIPVSSVAAERGFSLQNKIKTAMRSRLPEAKTRNLMTIVSAAISLDSFDYAQTSTQFKSIWTRRKVHWVQRQHSHYRDKRAPVTRLDHTSTHKKAYDGVPREEVWYCMRKSRVAEKYVRVVQDMYEGSVTAVRCAVGVTDGFKVEVGLHQGSTQGPFLFSMVMDRLTDEIRQKSPWTMMFADNIVICSKNRELVEEGLERQRYRVERRGMKVSRRIEYMYVNGKEDSGMVRMQGVEVAKVDEFKYLGSTVQSNGECGREMRKRVQAGRSGW
eukprot:superscaffoldBa00000808_g7365